MHGATRLPSGRVVVAGGANSYPTFLDSAEIYDPVGDSWAGTGTLREGRAHFPSVLMADGRVFAIGGFSYIGGPYVVGARHTTEFFDSAVAGWSLASPLIEDRRTHIGVTLADGRFLVAGGEFGRSDTHGVRQRAEIYDPAANTWTATGAMAFKRAYFAAVRLLDGRVLVAGGLYLNAPASPVYYPLETEIYDPTGGTWTTAASLANGRQSPTMSLLPDGRVLIAGGVDGSRTYDTAEIYNPATNTWSPAGTMSTARANHTATTLPDGRILVVGGGNGSGPVASVDIFTPP